MTGLHLEEEEVEKVLLRLGGGAAAAMAVYADVFEESLRPVEDDEAGEDREAGGA